MKPHTFFVGALFISITASAVRAQPAHLVDDAIGRPESAVALCQVDVDHDADGTNDGTVSLTYDREGHLIGRDGRQERRGYDITDTFVYDTVGNLLQSTGLSTTTRRPSVAGSTTPAVAWPHTPRSGCSPIQMRGKSRA